MTRTLTPQTQGSAITKGKHSKLSSTVLHGSFQCCRVGTDVVDLLDLVRVLQRIPQGSSESLHRLGIGLKGRDLPSFLAGQVEVHPLLRKAFGLDIRAHDERKMPGCLLKGAVSNYKLSFKILEISPHGSR